MECGAQAPLSVPMQNIEKRRLRGALQMFRTALHRTKKAPANRGLRFHACAWLLEAETNR